MTDLRTLSLHRGFVDVNGDAGGVIDGKSDLALQARSSGENGASVAGAIAAFAFFMLALWGIFIGADALGLIDLEAPGGIIRPEGPGPAPSR